MRGNELDKANGGKSAVDAQDALQSKAMTGLQEYRQKMLEKAYRVANNVLGNPPTVAQLMEAAAEIEGTIDIQVHRFAGKLEVLHQQGKSPDIACRKGCSYCCGTRIMASIPEVLRLASWVVENFSKEELGALRKRLAEFNAKVLAIKASGEQRPPIDCAILVNNSCSAHPGRPILCRAANSVDVNACINARENWRDQSLTIPLVGQPLYAGKDLIRGLRMALEERGIASPDVEMPLALEIALSDPSAGNRFLAGEPVFDLAIA